MKTEAVRHASFHKLSEEDDILTDFLYRNMEVAHPRIYCLQVVKFMVMSGKQCLCPVTVLMNVLNNGTGNGHSVICGSSPSDFIEQDERARRQVMKDHGSLQHLYHEGGFSPRNIV